MADYTPEDFSQAEELLHVIQYPIWRHGGPLDLPPAVSIVDIQRDLNEFEYDYQLATEGGTLLPAVTLGDGASVPVALSAIGLSPLPREAFVTPRRLTRTSEFEATVTLAEVFSARERRELGGYPSLEPSTPDLGTLPYHLIPLDIARETFFSRVHEFLAQRISAARTPHEASLRMQAQSGGRSTSVPGCTFSVSSRSPGLRVFWSGAYFISPNYFSQPTSPATSVLQAGTYVFGVDGGAYGNQIQWDLNAVCTLPGAPSVSLIY
jgi:hypothetical protein